MKRMFLSVAGFFYRVSGLQAMVDCADNRIFIYRKRVSLVPFTFKMFVWSLGLVSGVSGYHFYEEYPKLVAMEDTRWVFEQTLRIETAHAIMEEPEEVKPRDLVDIIFQLESQRGKENYSKCKAIGKFNRYGYGIPGNGEYVCFEKDEDTKAVVGWVAAQKAYGLTEAKLLCKYNTGQATNDCPYYQNSLKVK